MRPPAGRDLEEIRAAAARAAADMRPLSKREAVLFADLLRPAWMAMRKNTADDQPAEGERS